MSDFYSKLQATQDNVSYTENGAVGFKTTQHALLDFSFKVASYRSNIKKAVEDFNAVLKEGEQYVLKYLFYLRDAREGIGERDLFRVCLAEFVKSNFKNKDEIIDTIINTTPEYGRWDDLWVLLDTPYKAKVIDAVKAQLKKDMEALISKGEEAHVSLLGKWMPSETAHSKKTRVQAYTFMEALGAKPRQYRKMLTALRTQLKVVEQKTCAKAWGEINYNEVPSKANIKYSAAFLRNDETRRRQYLADLAHGVDKDGNVVKINSAVNTPHDVLHMYTKPSMWDVRPGSYDEAIEQLWNNLKEVPGLQNTIVVRDDSGSMMTHIGTTNITAYEVATALGIYCAQHNSDAYKDKIITFSTTPRYLDFSNKQTYGSLHSIYNYLFQHSECANTNIKGVFDLVLKTAVENNLDASELPEQILIVSDMEFDMCAQSNSERWNRAGVSMSLFSTIAAEYAKYGYKLPKLVFWNVNSRTGTIPCKQNETGVILLSGFSQNVLSMVNNGKTDPYEVLIDELNKPRYESVPLIEFAPRVEEPQKSKPKPTMPDFLH